MSEFKNLVKSFTFDPINFTVGDKLPLKPSWKQLKEKLTQIVYYIHLFGALDLNPNKESVVVNKLIEKKISSSGALSLGYACYFLKNRFIQGEEQISKEPALSLVYSVVVLKKRFLEGEKSIAKDSRICLEYCIRIFKRKKLPKEMHNMMLFHKMKNPNDKFVKRYLKFKGVAGI